MLMLSLAVITVSVSAYAMGVIRDSAVEGARFAALADQSTTSGCLRAQMLLEKALVADFSRVISCDSKIIAGVSYEKVRIQLGLPVIGLITGARFLTAESVAPREDQ